MPFKRKIPDEIAEFLIANATTPRLRSVVKEKFGVSLHKDTVNYYRRRYGKGIHYRPKDCPVTFLTKPVGSERLDKDGYIRVVVDGGKERLKHHLVWERENVPVKPDEVLIFLDGDRKNCEIENLFLLKRKFLGQLNWFVKQAGEITPEQRKGLILSSMLMIMAKEKEILKNKNRPVNKPKNEMWRVYVKLKADGLTIKQIAEKTGKNPNVVRWSLRRYALGAYE